MSKHEWAEYLEYQGLISRRTALWTLLGWAGISAKATAASDSANWLLTRTDRSVRLLAAELLRAINHIESDTVQGVSRRAIQVSEMLLGAEFELGPIGEGDGTIDSDPPFLLDRFDCMTFVEAVVALARSKSVNEVFDDLANLRYGNRTPSFASRNHFASVDWIPAGLSNLIFSYPKLSSLARATISVNKLEWLKRLAGNPMYAHNFSGRGKTVEHGLAQKTSVATIQYVRQNDIFHDNVLKEGLVAATLHPRSPLNLRSGGGDHIAHMGLIVQSSKGWDFRAASQVLRKVSDVPLPSLLFKKNQMRGPYGVVLLEVLPRSK